MKKKTSEFTKRKRALKACGDHIDPTMCITQRLAFIEVALRSPRVADPNSREFKACHNSVQYLLSRAIILNKQPFWDDLDYPPLMPDVPEPSVDDRHKNLSEALEQLKFEHSDYQKLDSALDALDDAIKSMQNQFAHGTASDGFEGCPVEMRYMCSAMLTAMTVGLAKVAASQLSGASKKSRKP
jgi:hypothetical protein